GGFGGERGGKPETFPALEGSTPVAKVIVPTRAEQALLYRLSGDFNPLHVDPGLATKVGFEGPILHGLCTYGFTVREAVTHLCDGDPSRLAAFSARFSSVVYPGDPLTVEFHPTATAKVFAVQVSVGDRVVLDQGWAKVR
ncbi:MAG: MaoC family dehydratase, partial [Myxococcales bacterium]|nr:MaoC family dehydratase [Myxococcales bacterium]